MSKAICIDELMDMLAPFDGCLSAIADGGGLLIVDEDGVEVNYIPFTEEA